MTQGLPGYISPVFLVTAFLTVGILFYAVRTSAANTFGGRSVLFLCSFWLVLQMSLGLGGFYLDSSTVPPKIFLFAVFPALILIAAYSIWFRDSFIDLLPLKTLTILHIVRIPIEFVLLWLFHAGQVPRAMTFEGSNFDILSGITAPFVYLYAFRGGRINTKLLIVWNIGALLLLLNVVIIAIRSLTAPLQSLSFDQPNVAVMYFPYIWLPAVIVPIVFFAHIASLLKLFRGKLV